MLRALKGKKLTLELDNKKIVLTNLDKIFWPDDGYTKGDLISFYLHISPYILPHLLNRPLSLKRYPNGIKYGYFFQKEAGRYVLDWIKTVPIFSGSKKESINYIICNDLPTLAYLTNLACISYNPWLSKWPKIDKPDLLTFDLDPSEGAHFEDVQEVALTIKGVLENLGLKSFVKTSGATGIHVYVPLDSVYSYAQVRVFAQKTAIVAKRKNPQKITIERTVIKRGGKVYIDYLQNIEGKTLACPYCLRARPNAPVSTPLRWDELYKSINPKQFNIDSIFERLSKTGDLWTEALILKQKLDFTQLEELT